MRSDPDEYVLDLVWLKPLLRHHLRHDIQHGMAEAAEGVWLDGAILDVPMLAETLIDHVVIASDRTKMIARIHYRHQEYRFARPSHGMRATPH